MIIPTATELYNKAKGKFTQQTLKNVEDISPEASILRVLSTFTFDLFNFIKKILNLNFWLNKLTENELLTVGNSNNINRIQATKSTGYINILASENTIIAKDSQFTANGKTYISLSQQVASILSYNSLSVSRIGTVATVVSQNELLLGSSLIVSISGFSESNFNKNNIEITMLNQYSFSYEVSNTGATSNTGGVVSFTGATVLIESVDSGLNTELSNGTIFASDNTNLTKIIAIFNGIVGGADLESIDNYRKRVKTRIQDTRLDFTKNAIISTITKQFPVITDGVLLENYRSTLNVDKIEFVSNQSAHVRRVTTLQKHNFMSGEMYKEIAGSVHPELNINNSSVVNRFIDNIHNDFAFDIWIDNTTIEDTTSNMTIAPFNGGFTTIVLYKKKSAIKTLNSTEIDNIKSYLNDNILMFGRKYYNIVSAIEQQESITISNLVPNTQLMKDAIKQNIIDYIITNINIGQSIKKSLLENLIKNTTDINNNIVISFDTNLSGDIVPSSSLHIIQINKNNILFS